MKFSADTPRLYSFLLLIAKNICQPLACCWWKGVGIDLVLYSSVQHETPEATRRKLGPHPLALAGSKHRMFPIEWGMHTNVEQDVGRETCIGNSHLMTHIQYYYVTACHVPSIIALHCATSYSYLLLLSTHLRQPIYYLFSGWWRET